VVVEQLQFSAIYSIAIYMYTNLLPNNYLFTQTMVGERSIMMRVSTCLSVCIFVFLHVFVSQSLMFVITLS